MPPAKTLVTDAKKLLGLTYEHFHTHGASATARKAASYLRTQALRARPLVKSTNARDAFINADVGQFENGVARE